jgi:hypothetical protein
VEPHQEQVQKGSGAYGGEPVAHKPTGPRKVLEAITAVFAIRNPQAVAKSDLPAKLKKLLRFIYPEKISGLTANRRHLAKLVLAVADYVTKLFCHARDPNHYHSAAFAAAAGVTLESLTQPTT